MLGATGSLRAANLSWAPHFVSVELIRASELVTIGLRFNTLVKDIARFKAQLLVPTMLLVIAHSKELGISVGCHFFLL